MDGSLPIILLGAVTVIGVLCVVGIVHDLRTGTTRLAHESHDVRRDGLPLNYWMGLASKGAGAAMALIIAVLVIQPLI